MRPLLFQSSFDGVASEAAFRVRQSIGMRRPVRWLVAEPREFGECVALGCDVDDEHDLAWFAPPGDGHLMAQVVDDGGLVFFIASPPASEAAWQRTIDGILAEMASIGIPGAARLLAAPR